MRNTLTITGAGITVRGTPVPGSETGIFVAKDGFKGWDGLAAGRREAIPRETTHGEHSVSVYLPGRPITLDVWIIAETLQGLGRASRRWEAWGATGDPFTLAVDHQGQLLTASVQRLASTADDTGSRWRRWYKARGQAQLFADDPRKLGKLRSFPESGLGTQLDVFHRGTFPAPVIVEIPDAPSSYTVTTPAGTFVVSGVPAGGTHRIDTATGQVTRNGFWMPEAGVGPLWEVPNGSTWRHTLSVPGRVIINDTFV